jgi:hypothetical protein
MVIAYGLFNKLDFCCSVCLEKWFKMFWEPQVDYLIEALQLEEIEIGTGKISRDGFGKAML